MKERTYISIDLKSFYASVECKDRELDPMDRSYGISGRGRLFEVRKRVREANAARQQAAPGHRLTGASCSAAELAADSALAVDFIIAPPRMAFYMEYSRQVYIVYLKYIAPEDMVVYSIDEVFMDVTDYLHTYGLSPRELARKIILDVLDTTGLTATAGIGTNLFLSKVAMDIVAKHIPADEKGVRIAELTEAAFREKLWDHRPLTDFWRVGPGIAKKLSVYGIFTMGDIALCSEQDEELLYQLFGKNAELLIDHAWGWEPCTVAAIKAYRPASSSLTSGQVLSCAYEAEQARLVNKGLVTDQIVLTVGYDIENLTDPARSARYRGEVEKDRYGRRVPKSAHGTENLDSYTSSARKIMDAATALFDRIIHRGLLVRRMYVVANHVVPEAEAPKKNEDFVQMDLFTDYGAQEVRQREEEAALSRERKLQEAALAIKKKYGKNALLKGMNLEEGATARTRNAQIGGHRA